MKTKEQQDRDDLEDEIETLYDKCQTHGQIKNFIRRALVAETELTAARARIAELEAALRQKSIALHDVMFWNFGNNEHTNKDFMLCMADKCIEARALLQGQE